MGKINFGFFLNLYIGIVDHSWYNYFKL